MKPIWIVDDDQSIRFVLEKALSREELPTRSFSNPRDVLAALDEGDGSPQVLVSDIRMPGGSGLDLLAQIKQRLPRPRCWARRPPCRTCSVPSAGCRRATSR